MINLRLIGASDAPAILGLHEHQSANDVYMRVRHGLDAPASDWLEQAGRLGNRYEEGTARELLHLLDEPDAEIFKPGSHELGGAHHGLRYSLDFVTARPRIIECKMRRWRSVDAQDWGTPGTGEVAPTVAAQVQAQLELVRLDRDNWVGTEIPEVNHVDVGVGVDGQEVLVYRVDRDPELGAQVVETLQRFWQDHCLTGIPPAIDHLPGTRRRLEHELRLASKRLREANDAEAELALELLELHDQQDELARRRAYLEHELMEMIGHDFGLEGDGWRVHWRSQRGNPSHKEVSEALALRLGIGPGELADLRDHHRSDDHRVFDARRVKPRITAARKGRR